MSKYVDVFWNQGDPDIKREKNKLYDIKLELEVSLWTHDLKIINFLLLFVCLF